MLHFGVLSYSGMGHLNPLMALSRQLKARGHRVTVFQKSELEAQVREQGLEFSPLEKSRSKKKNGKAEGRKDSKSRVILLFDNVEHILREVETSLRTMPSAFTKAGIDVLMIDEIVLSGPTLAEILNLPYFILSTSVPLNFGWSVSRGMSRYGLPASPLLRIENAFLQVSVLHMQGPIRRGLDEYRRQLGLAPVRRIQRKFPALAHIAQLPECLDFPRSRLPDNFHYTGPFVDETVRSQIQFPWHRLDSRPLVYASLGTARAVRPTIFRLIAEACNELDLQLVLSLGGRSDPDMFDDLPGSPLVVREAPQLEILKRAAVVITHGGLNTVLETLMEGKPILAIPIAYDQPAVANRLAWLGVAEVLPLRGLASRNIRISLQKLLSNESFRKAAVDLQGRIRKVCGLQRAADLIEAALDRHAGRPEGGSKGPLEKLKAQIDAIPE